MEQLINPELVYINVQLNNKKETLKFISREIVRLNIADKYFACLRDFKKREREGTTGLNEGIAIPHISSKHVQKPAIMILKLAQPIEWDSMDGSRVRIVIALITSATNIEQYIEVLKTLNSKLLDDQFRAELKSLNTKEQFLDLMYKNHIK